MATRVLCDTTVEVNDEGFFVDPSQWTEEMAPILADEVGVPTPLTDQHWQVIEFIQQSFQNSDAISIRSIGKRGPASIKEFYALFPDGPLKKASKIAGIPKPASCI